jgi:hypothetical protein
MLPAVLASARRIRETAAGVIIEAVGVKTSWATFPGIGFALGPAMLMALQLLVSEFSLRARRCAHR